MPTVRRRRSRDLRAPRIPQDALDAYRLAKVGQATYEACLAGDDCAGADNRHCQTCLDHLAATRALRSALGTPPFHPLPLDVDGPEPTEITGPGRCWWDGWPKAWEQRLALDAADGH